MNRESAKAAKDGLDGYRFANQRLRVEFNRPKEAIMIENHKFQDQLDFARFAQGQAQVPQGNIQLVETMEKLKQLLSN
jgi:RNA recognition motif-containing protein